MKLRGSLKMKSIADLNDTMEVLKEALRANILTRGRLSPAGLQLTANEARNASFGWVFKQPGMPTIADCHEALSKIANEFGPHESLVALQRFGVLKLKEVYIGLYQSLVDFCNACLRYGQPPSSSWQQDNTPTVPSRWLIFHDASDCIFEVFDYEKFKSCMEEGNCSDVTGKTDFELRLKQGQDL